MLDGRCVRMDCRGLVDPNNRPFGYVLPLEIQIKIMFWVHCFYTMDERKKVLKEFKELPKCSIMGFPKRLGEFHYWNQVVFRLHTQRTTPSPLPSLYRSPVVGECERVFFVGWGRTKNDGMSFFLVSDWHDGGNGT